MRDETMRGVFPERVLSTIEEFCKERCIGARVLIDLEKTGPFSYDLNLKEVSVLDVVLDAVTRAPEVRMQTGSGWAEPPEEEEECRR